MNDTADRIVIVMPAYNEEGCIEKVVRSWLTILDRIQGKFIVVNDGSTDRTKDILDQISAEDSRVIVIHQNNSGHGAATLRGYSEALELKYNFIFQTDSDDQFMPSDFMKLWEFRNKSPLVTGYRKKRHDSFHRLVITRIVFFLNWALFGVALKDSNVPFRLYRADFLRQLLSILPEKLFAPNICLTILGVQAGAKLQEIPISHEERKTGKVSIIRWKLVKICFRCARELISFRITLNNKKRTLLETGESRVS